VTGACFPVVEQSESDGETATDYDSHSLMQFCKSHQLLLGAYELLSQQNVSMQSLPSSADEHDIKSVSLLLSTTSSRNAKLKVLV